MKRGTTIAAAAIATALIVAGTAGAATIIQAGAGQATRSAIQVAALPDTPSELMSPTLSLPPLPALPSVSGTGSSVLAPTGQPSASAPQTTSDISPTDAASAVVAAAGGTVLGTVAARHQGFDCWDVTVERSDGSIVLGSVAKASGVIFAWQILSAPIPGVPSTNSDHKARDDDETATDDDSEHSGETHEAEDEDDGENAHEEDHETGEHEGDNDDD